jgi:hypothetical protein
MVCWPFAVGSVTHQHIVLGLHRETAYLMAQDKQREKEERPESQYFLQGHTPNNLASSTRLHILKALPPTKVPQTGNQTFNT